MEDLTKEEKNFLVQTLSQISFKAGQSTLIIMAESIINKLSDKSDCTNRSV